MKYTIEKFTAKGSPKLVEGNNKETGKPYSFWGAMFYADGKLIKMNGDKGEIEPLKIGSLVEGKLIEDPFTMKKDDGSTEQVMCYKLTKDPLGKVEEKLEDHECRILALEEATFGANKSEVGEDEEPLPEEPVMEIDDEDIPF
jgi:hypothetical protein